MTAGLRKLCVKVARRFRRIHKFVATERVDSEAIAPNRCICMPGDEIEVIKWYCQRGPTLINVTSHNSNSRTQQTCIPFSWVMEMGAPRELAEYMPFPEKSWDEILAEPVTA
jgi:hypothetical protein